MNEDNQKQPNARYIPVSNIPTYLLEQLKQGQEIKRHFVEQYSQIAKSLAPFLETIRNIDLGEVEQSHKEAVEVLAQKGWTIPMNMTPSDIIEISKIQDQNELDLMFQEFYKIEKEYDSIKSAILEHKLTLEWKELLIQCFDNYERESYLIVIPNLFIIIENLANILISPRYQKYINPKRRISLRAKFKEVQQEIINLSTYIIFYASVSEFLNSVFKAGNFDKYQSRFSLINRDWVLHGRDYPSNWRQVDALRLFNALHTIIELDFLLEDLEKEVHVDELVK
ncbi:hypothetical protein [Bacillus toyonensis]|uniref:hypothetical protein n=1 Tax=Bacillus toyonensis TaxID=155322 RepID=UPI000BEBBCD2|nr:hypothetical protein [Bacillus toyonensis]PEE81782.1 hypothetical protein COO15_16155 [Bacillus toyonensis]PHG02559.1 hypothetical protein COI49_15670 [Bacillus toyonensis]